MQPNIKTMSDAQIWNLIEQLFVACLKGDQQMARLAYVAALDERQARMRRKYDRR